jgi:intracellular septation protein
MNKQTKLLVEFGPLVVFFAANWFGGPYWATGAVMVATLIALLVSWVQTRKLAIMPLITAGFVFVFGGLTFWFHEQEFIQVKVTMINLLFGTALLVGVAFGRSYMKLLMESAMKLPDQAWKVLSIRWGVFFLGMALLNEVLRHMLSWDQWVTFKAFGLIGLTLVFAFANAPYMSKHLIEDEAKQP